MRCKIENKKIQTLPVPRKWAASHAYSGSHGQNTAVSNCPPKQGKEGEYVFFLVTKGGGLPLAIWATAQTSSDTQGSGLQP